MTDGCSIAPSRFSIKAGLLCSSAKTYRGTSPDNSKSPSRHWSDWGAALRLEYSARPRSRQVTAASDSSSWPTVVARDGDPRRAPTKPDSKAWANKAARGAVMANGMLSDDLSSSAVAWATPAAQRFEAKDLDRMFERQAECKAKGKSGNGFGLTLDNQVQLWPTPMAGSAGTDTYNAAGNSDFSRKAMALADPLSRHLHPDLPIPDGPRSLQPIPFSPLPSETSMSGGLLAEISVLRRWSERSGGAAGWSGTWTRKVRRRLNPRFAGWLMGWPEGLSGFDTAEMASCPSLRPSLGCGCMDCWMTRQREMLSDLLTIDPPAQGSLL